MRVSTTDADGKKIGSSFGKPGVGWHCSETGGGGTAGVEASPAEMGAAGGGVGVGTATGSGAAGGRTGFAGGGASLG